MRFHFNDEATAQAAAHLLRLNGGAMNHMVLVKLLYLADRRMLLEHGRPITGDRLVSMKHGPVLSRVLTFINEGPRRDSAAAWFRYIGPSANYIVSLIDPSAPTDELSSLELKILAAVHAEFGKIDKWDLVDHLHRILPEWEDPGSSSKTIEFVEILRREDRSPDDIERVKREADSAWLLG